MLGSLHSVQSIATQHALARDSRGIATTKIWHPKKEAVNTACAGHL